MPPNPLHGVAIVGAFNTRQARSLDVPETELLLDAMRGAVRSAGLTLADVDGIHCSSSTRGWRPRETAMWLGGRPVWTGTGDVGIPAVLEAALAIASGQCTTALIATAQAGEYTNRAETAPWTKPSHEFTECFGLFTAAEFALIARRHMHRYGTRREDLAEVAATIRNHGAQNPEAVMYGRRVTAADVLASRPIAEPFHLLDCALTSEGGAGLVLTSAERARDLPVAPVWLLGGALDRCGMSYVTPPVLDRYGEVGARAAQLAFAQCGLSPAAVDVAELYDPFSFEVIRQLEVFGFCPRGEGGAFVRTGRIAVGGALPVATNGGLLSFSHAGLAQLLQKPIAAVQQLRGELPDALSVPGAQVALASNGGAGALFCDVLLLGTERA
jgi:acetyl-CoA acetyltransferase